MGLIRVILAVAVVLVHASRTFFLPGMVAVESFFIISGFYMALILNEKYTGAHERKTFITNRLLRIYPLYWMAMVIGLIGTPYIFYHLKPHFQQGNIIILSFIIFSNIFILGQDLFCFLGIDRSNNFYFPDDINATIYPLASVRPAWTLSLELLFYFMAPFIAKRKTKIILLIIIASLACRYYTLNYLEVSNTQAWDYRFFPNELVFFMSGILSYRIYRTINKSQQSKYLLYGAFFSLLLFISIFRFIPSDGNLFGLPYKYCFFYLLVTACLPYIFTLTKNIKADRAIGELSYPIYLVHSPLIIAYASFQRNYKGNSNGLFHFIDTHFFFFTLTLTVLFSVLFLRATARIEKYRQRRISNSQIEQPTA